MSPAPQPLAIPLHDSGKVCADARCATLLAADTEICDECGGTRFEAVDHLPFLLCGWAGERPVVFALHEHRPSVIGRSTRGGPMPDIDLRRFPDSGFVHRRHALVELGNGQWQVTQLGSNPLVVAGIEPLLLESGATATLRSGDTIQVGGVLLQFVARPSAGRI